MITNCRKTSKKNDSKTKRWGLVTIYLSIVLTFFAPTSSVLAQQGSEIPNIHVLRKRGIHFVAPEGTIPAGCKNNTVFNGPVLRELPQEIREPYRTIFAQAATQVNVDPAIVMTLFYTEWQGDLNKEPPAPYGDGAPWNSSDVGASGPFQFMPDTWTGIVQLAQDELNISISDKMDLVDAAIGAAVFMRSIGATPEVMPVGDVENAIGRFWDDSELTVVNLLASYNAGPGYDSRVERYGETEAYIRLGAPFYQALTTGQLSSFVGSEGTPTGTPPIPGLVNTGCTNNTGVGGSYTNLGNMKYYGQCDPAWGSIPHGGDDICYSGCGSTSIAMVVATLSGRDVKPPEIADIVMNEGFYVPGEGISHAAFPAIIPRYGLNIQNLGSNFTAVKEVLSNGGLVIAAMGPGDFTGRGHIIVLRGVTPTGKILVADPNDSLVGLGDYLQKSNTEWDESTIVSQGSPFWGITK